VAKKRYRATINQTGVRAGAVIELDENDPSVVAKVANGYLLPVDSKGNTVKPAPAAPKAEPKDDAPKTDAPKADAPKGDDKPATK